MWVNIRDRCGFPGTRFVDAACVRVTRHVDFPGIPLSVFCNTSEKTIDLTTSKHTAISMKSRDAIP